MRLSVFAYLSFRLQNFLRQLQHFSEPDKSFSDLSSNGHVWIDIWLIIIFILSFAPSDPLDRTKFDIRQKHQVMYTYQASPFFRGSLTKFPISFFWDSRSGGPPSAIFIHFRKSRIYCLDYHVTVVSIGGQVKYDSLDDWIKFSDLTGSISL